MTNHMRHLSLQLGKLLFVCLILYGGLAFALPGLVEANFFKTSFSLLAALVGILLIVGR